MPNTLIFRKEFLAVGSWPANREFSFVPFHGEFGYRKPMPDGQSKLPPFKRPMRTCVSSTERSARLAERGRDGSRGLQPTVQRVEVRVAQRRMNWPARRGGRGSSVAPRREILLPPDRGLKPTATVSESLRDCKAWEIASASGLDCGGKSDATPLSERTSSNESGVALRFPPQSKTRARVMESLSINCWIQSHHESVHHPRPGSV